MAAITLAVLAPAAGASGPVSSHAQVYTCCTPYALKRQIFAESKAMGAEYIRVDVEMAPIVERNGVLLPQPDWHTLDDVMALSRAYSLPVLGVIRHTPISISACPTGPAPALCGASDAQLYGRLAGEIAAHAKSVITHWEIINEPDGSWAYTGTPDQYARMLSASYDEIHRSVPGAQVALGGQMSTDPAWLRLVFATPGADAAHKFDIANVHLRGRLGSLAPRLAAWRGFFASYGFTGPIWVTEHGYPSETPWQDEPSDVGGEAAQARYLNASLMALAQAGAEQIFVTLRDAGTGRWASEGVAHIDDAPPYASHRKAAFAAVRAFVDRWPRVPGWQADMRRHVVEFVRLRSLAAGQIRAAGAARAAQRRLLHRRAVYTRRARIARGRHWYRRARYWRRLVRRTDAALRRCTQARAARLLEAKQNGAAATRHAQAALLDQLLISGTP